MDTSSLVGDLIGAMNKKSTSCEAYLQGDHAEHTWGVEIPTLAFQWLIGGSNVLPCQRYFGISGEEKSYKSTLSIEMGNWYMGAGGIHAHLDTEKKTSSTMLDAMTWHTKLDANRRIFKICSSISEWQSMVSTLVDNLRKQGEVAKGERVPLHICVDSLTGTSTEDADRELRKEGAAKERGFPVASLQTTNFLESLNLLGTTSTVGWVQHMKEAMDQQGGYGKQYKEKGAKAAQFACSTHIRVRRGAVIRKASHPSAPLPDMPVEGHELYVQAERSCIGPQGRRIAVPLMWQYVVDEETGEPRQAMWFDWHTAFGKLLIDLKYGDKVYKCDKDRLADTLQFTETNKGIVNCKELELEKADCYYLGKVIQDDIDLYDRISKFLRIHQFPTVQEANIDFSAGDLAPKKGKR